jgi:hypothetical protein
MDIRTLFLGTAIVQEQIDVGEMSIVQVQAGAKVEAVFCGTLLGGIVKVEGLFSGWRKNGAEADMTRILATVIQAQKRDEGWHADLNSTVGHGNCLRVDVLLAHLWKVFLANEPDSGNIGERFLDLSVIEIEQFFVSVKGKFGVPKANVEFFADAFESVIWDSALPVVELRSAAARGDVSDDIADYGMILNDAPQEELGKAIDQRFEIRFEWDIHLTCHETFWSGIKPNSLPLGKERVVHTIFTTMPKLL